MFDDKIKTAADALLLQLVEEGTTITSLEFKTELRKQLPEEKIFQRDVSEFLQEAFKSDKMPSYAVGHNGVYNTYRYIEDELYEDENCDEEELSDSPSCCGTCENKCETADKSAVETLTEPLASEPQPLASTNIIASLRKRFGF